MFTLWYTLLAFHAEKRELEKMDALISGWGHDDIAAEWVYTKALTAFARRGEAGPQRTMPLRLREEIQEVLRQMITRHERIGDAQLPRNPR